MKIAINKEGKILTRGTLEDMAIGAAIGGACAARKAVMPVAIDNFKKSVSNQNQAIKVLQDSFARSGMHDIADFTADRKDLMTRIADYKSSYTTIKQLDLKYKQIEGLTERCLYSKENISPSEILKDAPKDLKEYVEGLVKKLRPQVDAGQSKESVLEEAKKAATSFRESKKANYEGLHKTVCSKGLKKALKTVNGEEKILKQGNKAKASKLVAIKDMVKETSVKIKDSAIGFIGSKNKAEYLKAHPKQAQALKKTGKTALIFAGAFMVISAAVRKISINRTNNDKQ